jgi:hypothetical protein
MKAYPYGLHTWQRPISLAVVCNPVSDPSALS